MNRIKANLFFALVITTFALASLILDIYNYNPYKAESWVFVSFFISLLLSITGVFGIIIYFFKIRFGKEKKYSSSLVPSFRQSFLIGIAVCVLAILKSIRLLDWWVGGPAVIAVLLLELFFQTMSPTKLAK